MHLNLTLLGQALTFAVFVWFTMRYVWPPLLAAIQQREKTIAKGLAAGEQGQRQLTDAQQQAEACLADARSAARAMLVEAHNQSQQLLEAAKRRAEDQQAQRLQQVEAQITQKWLQLKHQLGEELGQLVVLGTTEALKFEAASHTAQHQWIQRTLAQWLQHS